MGVARVWKSPHWKGPHSLGLGLVCQPGGGVSGQQMLQAWHKARDGEGYSGNFGLGVGLVLE